MDKQQQLARYINFLKADPDNPNLLFSIAELNFQLNQLDRAGDYLTQLIKMPSPLPQAFRLKGVIFLHQGKISQAIDVFQTAIKAGDTSLEVNYNLAYALMLEEDYSNAEQYLLAILSGHTALPQIAHLYVKNLYFQERFDEAINFANEILKNWPDRLAQYGILAMLYLDNDDDKQALSIARQVINEVADDPEANVVIGLLALDSQNEDDAGKYLSKVLSINGTSRRALMGYGTLLMQQGNFAESERYLSKAIELYPSDIEIYYALAWCLLFLDKLEAAHQLILRALAIDADRAETLGILAIILFSQGEFIKAEDVVNKARRSDIDDFFTQYAQALLLEAKGKVSESQLIMQKLLDKPLLSDQRSLNDVIRGRLSKKR